jgi:ribosomal protein L31
MPRPIRHLTDMEIDEISTVDKAANQYSRFVIAKRAPEEDEMPKLYNQEGQPLDEDNLDFGDIVYDDEGNAYEYVEEESEVQEDEPVPELANVGKSAFFEQQTTNGPATGSFSKSVMEELSKAFSDSDRDAVIAKALGRVEEIEQRYEEVAKAAQAERDLRLTREYISKAFSDSDRDAVIAKALGRVEEIEQRYEEVAKAAQAERDLRLTREYISKAAEYNLPVAPAELGPVLYRMAETMSYDDCAVIAKCLETAGSMLFEETGYQGGGDNADIYSQVEAHAYDTFGKAEDYSPVTAINKVFDTNPDAYDEYLAAQRNR